MYLKLKNYIWVLFVGAALLAVVVMLITLTQVLPENTQVFIARALYAFIPLVLTFNLLGWALRLTRLTTAIREVEIDLERLRTSLHLDIGQATRLRSEYNCQIVEGFPTPDFLYQRWKREILVLWEKHWQDLQDVQSSPVED
jgi:hypothetical protein